MKNDPFNLSSDHSLLEISIQIFFKIKIIIFCMVLFQLMELKFLHPYRMFHTKPLNQNYI